MRYSSVYRGREFDDSGYEEEEDILLDSQNIETFGDSSDSLSRGPVDDEAPSSKAAIGADLNHTDFNDQAKQLASEIPSESFSVSDSESRIQDNLLGEHGGSKDAKESTEKLSPSEDPQLSNSIGEYA
ncbi:hypothetical protein Gorai_008368 [Gossypium raimondii]|uniref:Uncharacterized protein n=1 Tax=Gossypium raimondii TaxID=29730 RepID=A0A7J8QBV6_GOSRA|nr:hypothetical protein [Gossypium raimondii]